MSAARPRVDRARWRAATMVLAAATMLLVASAACTAPPPATAPPHTGMAGSGPSPNRAILSADPSNYRERVRALRPGDTLVLQPGVYDDSAGPPGLAIFNLHGEPDRPIVIAGSAGGRRPVFRARATHNTVRIANASHVVIRNLELDGRGINVDAVKAQGISHHITIENLVIRNHGNHQQNVGISTKAPAWNWVIRGNIIERAGTGMYLGFPDGSAPFVHGLIEHNLVVDSLGYNIQIKHQTQRPTDLGMPESRGATIVRHNVFAKSAHAARGHRARPNLLVGHFPRTGAGALDVYEIYGNLFYQNESEECLFQGEGNIALYNNLFVNDHASAVCIQPHKDVPRRVRVFYNTILARNHGIHIYRGDPGDTQLVFANAVFARDPVLAPLSRHNVTDALAAAPRYLTDPFAPLGKLNLVPRPGALQGPPIDPELIEGYPDAGRDFDGAARTGVWRGAYATEGGLPRWLPALDLKPPID